MNIREDEFYTTAAAAATNRATLEPISTQQTSSRLISPTLASKLSLTKLSIEKEITVATSKDLCSGCDSVKPQKGSKV